MTPEAIRGVRKSLGLTQAQAGALVHSSGRTWQSWELGVRNMPAGKWELFLIKTEAGMENAQMRKDNE